MNNINGIKSVDFRIKASGHGAVNWNGSTNMMIIVDGKGQNVTNHSMPKLRGFTNIKNINDKGNPVYKQPENVDLTEVSLYVSQNCLKHNLFKSERINPKSDLVAANPSLLLMSMKGLIGGYVVTKGNLKRKSALNIEDMVDQLGNGNFEQFGQAGSKEKTLNKAGKESSTSIFSKYTFGDTEYICYGSINIEDLQFIPLVADFDRQAMKVSNKKEGKELAVQLTDFINAMGDSKAAKVSYHDNYVRNGAIYPEGEAGLLLNDEAIDIVVKNSIEMLSNLVVRQAQSYLHVDSIDVDYNNGNAKDMMRIKRNDDSVLNTEKTEDYAVYYEGK
jgi:hypothetical protein